MRIKPPLYLRGRIWWCTVTPPSGKGRRIPRTTRCQDRDAALIVWRRLERESVSPPDPKPATTTLAAALNARHNERRAVGRRPGTLSMMLVKGRMLLKVLGNVKLSEIDAEAVDGYIAYRVGEGIERTTIAKELTTLRGALKLAKRHGKFHRALEDVMPIDFTPGYKPKERKLSEREIAKLLSKLPAKRAGLTAFLLATGATYPSELADLRKGDVDKRRWMVRLRGTKRESRDRFVPIVEFARPWLTRSLEHMPFEPWTNIRRDLHRACDAIGIAHCSPNDLRRSVASLMRARGVEPQLIGAFLGHNDSRMAERVYGRITPEQLAHLLGQRLRSTARRHKAA